MGSASPKHTCLKLEISSKTQKERIFVKGTWFSSHFDLFITDGLEAWTCLGIFPFIQTQSYIPNLFNLSPELSLIAILHIYFVIIGVFSVQRRRKRQKIEHLSGINPFLSILIWVKSIWDFNSPALFMALMMLALGIKGSAFLIFIFIFTQSIGHFYIILSTQRGIVVANFIFLIPELICDFHQLSIIGLLLGYTQA